MPRVLIGTAPFIVMAAILTAAPGQARPDWDADLRHQEIEALKQLKPLVVDFVGQAHVPSGLEAQLTREMGTRALYARVWPGEAVGNSDHQDASEKHFNVTIFPTILVLEPFMTKKDFESGGFYEFREVDRCIALPNSQCENIIKTVLTRRNSSLPNGLRKRAK